MLEALLQAIDWLAGWHNWPFLLPLFIGVIFILVDFVLGGLGDLAGGDADMDIDVDVDADMDFDFDLAGGDFEGPDLDVAANKFGAFLLSGLGWLGAGKVPTSVLIQAMLISWGSTGLFVNVMVMKALPWGNVVTAFPAALICAFLVAPMVTRKVGGFFAKVVPADGTISRKAGGFTGETGETASSVSTSTGQVKVQVGDNPQIILNAKRLDPQGDTIPRGVSVLLAEYEAAGNIYLVVPTSELEL
jgi:hypothetical protein